MKKSHQIITGFVFGTSLLFAMPGLALADHDSPRVGVNFSFGLPVYEQPAYVYARPQPVYVYTQPRTVYYQPGYYDNQYYRGYEGDNRHWHEHGHHHDEEDDDD